jgi:hypothetical protein
MIMVTIHCFAFYRPASCNFINISLLLIYSWLEVRDFYLRIFPKCKKKKRSQYTRATRNSTPCVSASQCYGSWGHVTDTVLVKYRSVSPYRAIWAHQHAIRYFSTRKGSRLVRVTIDGVSIGEWIYWPLINTTWNYNQLQRHCFSPKFTNHHSTR